MITQEEMLDAMKRAVRILGNIPEDLQDWALVNLQIQEAHDILDDAIYAAKSTVDYSDGN